MEKRLVELINLALAETESSRKVEYLFQIKELALNHGLLNDFFQDILAFQNDRSPNVKKFVLAFIEAACKHDFHFCPKAILSLNIMLNDTNIDIIKRSVQVANQFYKQLVQWTNDANNELSDEVEKTWLMWLQIENLICNLLETTNNDGVRTHCIKFIETIVLMQTPCDKHTNAGYEVNLIDSKILPVRLSDEASICGVLGLPKNGVLFNEDHKLELVEGAKSRFEQLVVFHGASHISSVNLMAAMQSLVVLAKQRYRLFMGRVIQALDSLNNKLPPTLTESQVQSVKKFLKLQLTVMLKHPYSLDYYQAQITQLLQSVGYKQPEIHKVINDFKAKTGVQKKIKLEPGVKVEVSKSKHLDLNLLTQELDEKEKRQIVADAVKRILNDEKRIYIPPSQMDIKKKVLSTLANEFNSTECPKIIQDYIFNDLRNRHEICYAIIRKNFDVAAAKAARRKINLLDNQELLKNYFDCFNSYLDRAMGLKDSDDREIILPKLYALREEYYSITNQDQETDDK